jgi:hypothetical protein
MGNTNKWIAVLDAIEGLRPFCTGYGFGGDPYLHLQVSKLPRPLMGRAEVCAFNVMVKHGTPQNLVDQIPLHFNDGEETYPVMVLFASSQENREVRRRLHTGEVINTPDWGELLGLKQKP